MAACRSQGGNCRIVGRLGNQLQSRSDTAWRTHSHGTVRSARRFAARRYGALMSWGLCIARALVLKPSTLLMDEPRIALDPSATVERMIGNLRGRYTVVVVTHSVAQARRIANSAVHSAILIKVAGRPAPRRCQSEQVRQGVWV